MSKDFGIGNASELFGKRIHKLKKKKTVDAVVFFIYLVCFSQCFARCYWINSVNVQPTEFYKSHTMCSQSKPPSTKDDRIKNAQRTWDGNSISVRVAIFRVRAHNGNVINFLISIPTIYFNIFFMSMLFYWPLDVSATMRDFSKVFFFAFHQVLKLSWPLRLFCFVRCVAGKLENFQLSNLHIILPFFVSTSFHERHVSVGCFRLCAEKKETNLQWVQQIV